MKLARRLRLPTEQKIVVPNATQWLIAEPVDYPTELVAALSRLYATKRQAERAWIAHYQNAENTEGQGNLLVALDLKDGCALGEPGQRRHMLVKSYVHNPKYVDFAQYCIISRLVPHRLKTHVSIGKQRRLDLKSRDWQLKKQSSQ